MRATFRIDQLHIDPSVIASPLHAAFENVMDPEFAADLLRTKAFALVGKGGSRCDHETP